MRTASFLFAVAILALTTLAQGPTPAPTGAEAGDQATAREEVAAQPERPAPAGEAIDHCSSEPANLSGGGHCPYGAPRCWNDDQCDAYCGDPRFGYCFSNRCCGCTG